VAAAIDQRNDRFLGDRRDTLDAIEDHRPRAIDPVPDPAAYETARWADDLQVDRSVWAPVHVPLADLVSVWSLAITNRSRAAAWLDIRFESVFAGADGRAIATHEGVIKQILEPGQTRAWPDLAGGIVPDGAVSATFRITGAEKAIPRR